MYFIAIPRHISTLSKIRLNTNELLYVKPLSSLLDSYDNCLNQYCSLFKYFDKVVSLDSRSWYIVTSIIIANDTMGRGREILKIIVIERWFRSTIGVILESTHSIL